MRAAVLVLCVNALVAPPPSRRLVVRGRVRDEEEEAPAKPRGAGKAARNAARLAAEALGDDRKSDPKKLRARDKVAARRGGAPAEEKPERKDARSAGKDARAVAAEDDRALENLGLDDRLKLRGVAAAESAYAAAELAAAAAALEDEAFSPFAHLDASETKAAALALDNATWPSAVLVGLDITSRRVRPLKKSVLNAGNVGWSVDESLTELAKLCETARLRVTSTTSQRLEVPNGATLVGKGKIEEIASLVEANRCDAVVFDDELTVAQQRTVLSELRDLGCPTSIQVLDRTQLVLQIFSERAKTREAKTQVALARAEYMLPRLQTFLTTGAGMDSRGGSGGGSYLKGAGETQLEMDRRLFGKRIQKLKKDLGAVAQKRRAIRDRSLARSDQLPLVALVGYTNAGKTTILNAMSEASEPLYADDKLFATLDPTTRRVALPTGRACKLTDTVGFLQKLPTRLIASFRATLEEITDACLIIHVVDASDRLAPGHVDAVNAIIAELGAADVPQIRVLNKLDKCAAESDAEVALQIGARIVAKTSATTGSGIDNLLQQVDDALSAMNSPIYALVPFEHGSLLNQVYTSGTIVDLEHLEHGTRIRARVPVSLRAKLEPFAIPDDNEGADQRDGSPLAADEGRRSEQRTEGSR